ncbi:MAG: hypothetical protein ETSY2_41080, partial [Candidatus Entotheonella gemina]
MNLLALLFHASPGMIVIALGAGLVNGVCHASLLALINKVLHHEGASLAPVMWPFIGLGLATVLTGTLSSLLLYRFAQHTIAKLRMDLSRQILGATLPHIEGIGSARLMATLTDDLHAITQSLLIMPQLALNSAILMACAVYLCWLSWGVFVPMAAGVLAGVGGYRFWSASAFAIMRRGRAEQDTLFSHFRALTEGFKELKLNRQRREAFLKDHLFPSITALQRYNIMTSVRFVMADGWSLLLLFGLIGVLLFGLSGSDDIGKSVLTGYVLTTIYMMRPLGMMLRNVPLMARGQVALRNVETLGFSLQAPADLPGSAEVDDPKPCSLVALRDVTYTYYQVEEDRPFTLGPLTLDLQPGEVIFIVGGNGSGKTTLAKLLCGLYVPDHGEVYWDQQPVTDASREAYRQLFSAVFADCYLFETLLGVHETAPDGWAQDYLTQLQLSHKVTVQQGVLSTTALSQGQKKRLVLLAAYLA